MSQAKRMLDEQEEKKDAATEIAVKTGLLKKCDVCSDITQELGVDQAQAYRYANSLITKNDPLVAVFQGNRRELTDLIKDVVDGCGTECYCKTKQQ